MTKAISAFQQRTLLKSLYIVPEAHDLDDKLLIVLILTLYCGNTENNISGNCPISVQVQKLSALSVNVNVTPEQTTESVTPLLPFQDRGPDITALISYLVFCSHLTAEPNKMSNP